MKASSFLKGRKWEYYSRKIEVESGTKWQQRQCNYTVQNDRWWMNRCWHFDGLKEKWACVHTPYNSSTESYSSERRPRCQFVSYWVVMQVMDYSSHFVRWGKEPYNRTTPLSLKHTAWGFCCQRSLTTKTIRLWSWEITVNVNIL